jgi:hypothetical protein
VASPARLIANSSPRRIDDPRKQFASHDLRQLCVVIGAHTRHLGRVAAFADCFVNDLITSASTVVNPVTSIRSLRAGRPVLALSSTLARVCCAERSLMLGRSNFPKPPLLQHILPDDPYRQTQHPLEPTPRPLPRHPHRRRLDHAVTLKVSEGRRAFPSCSVRTNRIRRCPWKRSSAAGDCAFRRLH